MWWVTKFMVKKAQVVRTNQTASCCRRWPMFNFQIISILPTTPGISSIVDERSGDEEVPGFPDHVQTRRKGEAYIVIWFDLHNRWLVALINCWCIPPWRVWGRRAPWRVSLGAGCFYSSSEIFFCKTPTDNFIHPLSCWKMMYSSISSTVEEPSFESNLQYGLSSNLTFNTHSSRKMTLWKTVQYAVVLNPSNVIKCGRGLYRTHE